jgi:hypothetical protein
MKKTITFVGTTYMEGEGVRNIRYESQASLLDGDIVVISPRIGHYLFSSDMYRGKRCLDDNLSFQLTQATAHWRNEISTALTAGRTVIILLESADEVYVATGEKQHSGTGRNRHTTRVVTEFEPYSLIPGNVGTLIRKSGERISTGSDLGAIAAYWKEFGPFSNYQIYIEGFTGTSLLETSTGGKVVGGLLTFPDKPGKVVLLPVPNLQLAADARAQAMIGRTDGPEQDPMAPARKAKTARSEATDSVVNQFFSSIIGIDRELREGNSDTGPAPQWVEASLYELPEEPSIKAEIENISLRIKTLGDQQNDLLIKLERAQILKGLLFQKGHRLEDAVIQALGTLGYQAANVKEGTSEFDVLFVDPEGRRFIGEAEGRDDKAIGVEKLDQLERNIREDFSNQLEDSATYAHGVLFGNAFRLREVEKRGEPFTNKCLQAAARSKVRLVSTPELFVAAKHVLETGDQDFATVCRLALGLSGGEVVKFPELRTANLIKSTGQKSSAEVEE